MSDLAIEIINMGKMYKLFSSPRHKVFDAFGLNRLFFWKGKKYDEFWALRGLSINIKKGERVGLIGRNGAGKSTLLKIISRNVTPTEGDIRVNGNIQALMELGTGFHPEFTGRQNIRASLAYQGYGSSQIARLEDEIIDFAELEEFIDQPIKTYSAGMYARLAFSTSTSIRPEILIIDEVLGAGDAYFAGKCVERMRQLTEDSGATVLFVSHDLGSVQQLCNRAVWIDRGQILMDDEPLKVTKAYYSSILKQDELRLKARNARLARRQLKEIVEEEQAHNVHEMLGRFVVQGEQAPRFSHSVYRLTLTNGKDFTLSVEPGAPMDNDKNQPVHLLTDPFYMNWSEPKIVNNRRVRCFENVGGRYVHAPFVFSIPGDLWNNGNLILEIEHAAQPGENVIVEVFDGIIYHSLGSLLSGGKERHVDAFPIRRETGEGEKEAENVATTGNAIGEQANSIKDKWDTAEAAFTEIKVIDSEGHNKHIFVNGEPFGFRISVMAKNELKECWLAIAIYDGKGNCVSQWLHKFENSIYPGHITWDIISSAPNLRQGDYIVSFGLLSYYDPLTTEQLPYYCRWNRSIMFRIDEHYVGHIPLGIVSIPFEIVLENCNVKYHGKSFDSGR